MLTENLVEKINKEGSSKERSLVQALTQKLLLFGLLPKSSR